MAIRHFDLFFILTEGGPGDASHVVAWRIYVETFRNLSFGTGAAMSYILALATLALAYVDHPPAGAEDLMMAMIRRRHKRFVDHRARRRRFAPRRSRRAARCRLVMFVAYMMAPIAWLVSSSFQSEHEIISKPPHWIPHEPTLAEFCGDLHRQGQHRHLRDAPRASIRRAAGSSPPPPTTCCPLDAQQLHRGLLGGRCSIFLSAFRRHTPWPRSASAGGKPRSMASSQRA